jgi:YqjK-like protein
MRKQACTLANRRQNLLEEAAQQRLLLKQVIETWRPRLLLADQGIATITYFTRHPVLTASASLGLLAVTRFSRISKWFRRGWLAWQVLRSVRSFYTK